MTQVLNRLDTDGSGSLVMQEFGLFIDVSGKPSPTAFLVGALVCIPVGVPRHRCQKEGDHSPV